MTQNETARGLVHIYCGDGKGKTSCAAGLALRAAHSGMQVVILQFLKDGTSHEMQALAALPNVTVLAGKVCEAFFWNMTDQEKTATRRLHDELLDKAAALPCDLLVLDEACAAVNLKLVDTDKLRALLDRNDRPETVLTGRDPADFLLDRADYITEMVKRRHPFDKGIPAREGIEF